MKYYIGIDGGGTKTAFTIGKNDGIPLYTIEKTGSSHKDIGIDAVVELITNGVREIAKSANVSLDDCAGCCMGLPCYTESPEADIELEEKIKKALAKSFLVWYNCIVKKLIYYFYGGNHHGKNQHCRLDNNHKFCNRFVRRLRHSS